MRQRRLLVVLAMAGALLWAPRDAAARCELGGPYLGTGPQLPLGCPLQVYVVPQPGFVRQVTVLRSGAYVDVTGTTTPTTELLRVERTFEACSGPPSIMRNDEPYERWAIQPTGVTVGERIGFGMGWVGGIEIVAAAPCAAPIAPTPACTESIPCPSQPPFDTFEPKGCAASLVRDSQGSRGGGGLAIGLLLLGLLRWAPRRRRR